MAWPWDDINALGDRLASGYDPRDPTPPADVSTYGTQASQIIADLYGQYPGLQTQPANVQQQLYATVISGLKDNKGNEAAVRAALPSVASKIVSDGNAAAQSLGRLAPGDPSTTDPNGLIILPNGDRLDNNNHLIIHKDGTVTGISAGASQTAAESAASLASAAASNAAANHSNILSGIDLQNAARAGQETFPGSGIIWKADGTVAANGALTAKDKADIQAAQDQLKVQQQNADTSRLTQQQTGQYQQGQLANEQTRNANDAAYQTGQLGIGQEGNRLKGVEIGNTATYQQGQLNQGEQRIGLDTAVAQADAAAKAQQNDLARQQYIAKVLSSPSDFISRAFMQRGEASPLSQVTHADLINQVNREYANAPTAFTAPQTPTNTLLQPNAPAPTAAYAQGSGRMVNDRLAIVGDPQVNGVPNPEVIHNPTGAPISVTPMSRLQSGDMQGETQPQSQSQEAPPTEAELEQKKTQQKIDALSRLLQHVETPETQHALVDELASHRGRLKAYADGTDSGGSSVGWNASTGMLTSNGSGAAITGLGTSTLGTSTGAPTSGSSSNGTSNTGWSTNVTANPNYRPGAATSSTPGYVAPTIPSLTLPSLSIPNIAPVVAPAPIVSQEELVNRAQQNLPPALKALFGGDATAAPFNTTNRTQNPLSDTAIRPLNFGFSLFSPQSLAQLTDAEKQALDSYLGVKYNTTLADVATGMQQSFGRLSGGSSNGGGRLKIG